MFSLYRTTLPALCLTLILPCSAHAEDGKKPETAPDATAQRPALIERNQEDALALERQVPKEEQQTLQAGSDTFLALWKPANSPTPQGVLVILAGAGESADWPKTVGPLRRKFPDADWGTLSLALPDLLTDSPVARSESPAPAAKTEDTSKAAPAKDTPADANANIAQATAVESETEASDTASAENSGDNSDAERIFARLDAAVAYAQQHNARSVVVLGSGTGAYWATRYLSERQPAQVQKLVMVSVQTPVKAERSLDSLTATLKVPTADFYYNDQGSARQAAKQRLQASKRMKDSDYKQVALTAMPGNRSAEQEQLFRRIRGWLSPSEID
ncbi:alpha/beta hydrolase family protein [Pseudomonas sp. zfem002]|uniref:alpha/beta hydrolase family protein n=1 Tax=Pseudomonas sp. zfem002 TaxID=3078197 RepID=UPI0029286011|nr:alpha/beta hydrolase family protein [Pseudomonas sp. zfem002]MDU9391008.1 alpha/beta hydrolase family protein [Pseudomonas sp. zfem002]